jgi:hypothetical protein
MDRDREKDKDKDKDLPNKGIDNSFQKEYILNTDIRSYSMPEDGL